MDGQLVDFKNGLELRLATDAEARERCAASATCVSSVQFVEIERSMDHRMLICRQHARARSWLLNLAGNTAQLTPSHG